MSNEITLRQVKNGFVLKWEEESDFEENRFFTQEAVFEYDLDGSEDEKRKCFSKVLDFLIDFNDCSYQKHSNSEDLFIKVSMVKHKDFFNDESDFYE